VDGPAEVGTSDRDEFWMRAALEWSARGRGWTSPRPSVGSVLVREGRILGGGHTQPGDGQPHAEVMALRAALAADPERGARGATAYATLEPCSHWGTTPPCCDALIAAGVVRVVAGVVDPNPLIAGRGFKLLREAGIEVRTGVLEDDCFRAHDDFLKTIVQHTPFVTLKSAVSLDGKIALPDGSSQWITGEESRARAHRARHEHDAVLVGIGTVLADDPALSVRLEGRWKQPVRVVLDSRARLPVNARLFEGEARVIVFVSESEAPEAAVLALKARGAKVLVIPKAFPESERWSWMLGALFDNGIQSVLIEGGAAVAGSALRSGVVDKLLFFVAPMIIGKGIPAVKGFQVPKLDLAPRLERVKLEQLGTDVLVSGYIPIASNSLPIA